jgi:hypothetical protein
MKRYTKELGWRATFGLFGSLGSALTEFPSGDVFSPTQLALHTPGTSYPVDWVTVHDKIPPISLRGSKLQALQVSINGAPLVFHAADPRVNLDVADPAHRVTLLTPVAAQSGLTNFNSIDGSTYDPYTNTMLFTQEAGRNGGVIQLTTGSKRYRIIRRQCRRENSRCNSV